MWKWLNRMLDEMRVSSNVGSLPAGIELPVLRREVEIMANTVGKMGFSVVLSHGDLKPSNVMLLGDDPVDDVRLIDLDVRLIDLELAGPNYRGFDLAKLFRIDPSRFSEERFSEFLCVLRDCEG